MARGRLRIYLGAAPGVGKTVAMLSEGARRAKRGADVVVALVETHQRPRTAEMLEGLEVIARKEVTYRGSTVSEMDLDAVLARRPEVALVDELAHSNATGSRHAKRWQDVVELLEAGISVISTVNIQHLESLNDAVTAITGVRQHETVPDHVVRSADQVELVDMSPEALRRRMAHGNVYRADKVDAALSRYFRVGNLAALRELALLWLADRVDEAVEQYRDDHHISSMWPTRERVVVALSGSEEGGVLLRRGARIASRGAGGELHAVYVARDDGLAGPTLTQIAALRSLTEELGGTFHTTTGDDVASAVLSKARALNASQVVVGSSRRPAWRRLLRRGTGEAVISASGDIDVLVVTHDLAGRDRRAVSVNPLSPSRVRLGLALAAIGPGLLTALLVVVPVGLGLPLMVQLYLLVTVLVALVGGLWPAIAAAVASSLLLNWFLTPPVRTLTIADPENAAALAVFVATAAAVASVVHRSARRAMIANRAQRESAALADLARSLLASTDQMPLLLEQVVDLFGARGAAVVRRDPGGDVVVAATPSGAGAPGSPEPADLTALGPEAAREPVDASHDLVLFGEGTRRDRPQLRAACAAHANAVLRRRTLERSANDAEWLARDNRARRALLSAVSHDLRTPLAAIKAAIGSLRSQEVTFSPSDQNELKSIIDESTDRLDGLVGNLLDLSRLQADALVVHPCPVVLGDLVGRLDVGAAPTTPSGEGDRPALTYDLAADAQVVWADPGLLERVLSNVVENAVRHSPADRPVTVATTGVPSGIEIHVIDQGPGVDATQRERMFVPFQRLGDAPDGDGVGLGLAVARGLTEAMGGEVSAEDTPGGGLTIIITLPVPPDPALPGSGVER